jgi:excisionase family DNA binding protein
MTVPELAARLGIDPSTAFRYLRSGKLPGVQVGSRWLIDRARVERFLAGLEDAAGRPLIQAPSVNDTPLAPGASLTLLPERTPDTTETAMTWLRGARAAVDLLVGSVAGMGHAEGDEGTGHRLRA